MRGLTITNPDLERKEIQTPSGMAFWAGTGPDGAKCGNCVFYGYYYTTSTGKERKRDGCRKYFQLMRRVGEALSGAQIGCKYFEGVGHEAKEEGSTG